MTELNAPLLKQTLAHIEANPQDWDQESYRCRTGMCFAGWAATLAGGQWVTDDPDTEGGEDLIAEDDDPSEDRDGDVIDIWYRARRILGLGEYQAESLFDPDNTLDDLRRIVGQLCQSTTPRDEGAH